ncbi:heat shock factor protein HSF24 [Apiospora arundinis]
MSAASMLGFAIELHRRFEGNALPELRGRSTEAPGSDQPTTLTLSAPLLVLSGVICLPVIAFLCYTLGDLLPVLAIVEDTSQGGYVQLPLESRSEMAHVDGEVGRDVATEEMGGSTRYRPISASIRSTLGLLWSIAGFTSLFRGFGCFLVLNAAKLMIQVALGAIPFVPSLVADVLPPLLTVPVHVAWTQMVVSAPSARPFWHRLPGFVEAFRATALPAAVFMASAAISRRAPFFLFHVLGVATPSSPFTLELPPRVNWDVDDLVKMACLMATCLVFIAVLVTPSHAVLTRIEASVIPDEDRTVIPFDRTFGTKSSTQGFLSIQDAWESLRSEVWWRLVKLNLKIFALSTVIYGFLFIVVSLVIIK